MAVGASVQSIPSNCTGQALKPHAVQAWYTSLLRDGRVDGQGLSPKSVLRYHQMLHAAMHQAVRWQLLVRNPLDAVEPPRSRRRELLALPASDVSRLLEAADARGIGSLVRTAVLTGLRRGELLGLRWRDVDLDGGVAHVQQVAQRIDGQGMVFREPKTRLSRRALALSPETVAMLRRVRLAQLEDRLLAGSAWHDLDLVFTTGLGTAIEPGNLTRAWIRVQADAGVGHLRWHDLRHAHATLLLSQGVHPKVVSERLGHASVAITLDTYSHVLPGLQASAAAALDGLLASPKAREDVG